jgi:hypothetical protein
MEMVEKLARVTFMVLAAALFGWVFALLALETAWRRWRAARRGAGAATVESAYVARPKTRPTREFRTRRATSW